MYVRRWPRISDSSRTPPTEMRSNLRPIAAAIDLPSDVLPTPGGPTKQRIERARVRLQLAHREELEDPVLDLLDVVVVAVEHLARVLRGRGCRRSTSTTAASRSTRGRCGSRRARPPAAGAARSAAARARPASARARAGPPASSCSRSSLASAIFSSTSPSSSWIAFSCWRRKYSRWPFSISDWTCDWIFVPIEISSSSRASSSDSRRSRCATSRSSSSSCFSSVLIRSAPAIMCASSPGSSRFATAICSSSGRYGTSSMICENVAWTLRCSASSSGDGVDLVGQLLDPRDQVGVGLRRSRLMRTRCGALDEDPQRAVGHLEHARDDAGDADVVEVVGPGLLDLAGLRGDHHQHPVAGEHVVDELDRALLADRQRRQRVREGDAVAQRQHRQRLGQLRAPTAVAASPSLAGMWMLDSSASPEAARASSIGHAPRLPARRVASGTSTRRMPSS